MCNSRFTKTTENNRTLFYQFVFIELLMWNNLIPLNMNMPTPGPVGLGNSLVELFFPFFGLLVSRFYWNFAKLPFLVSYRPHVPTKIYLLLFIPQSKCKGNFRSIFKACWDLPNSQSYQVISVSYTSGIWVKWLNAGLRIKDKLDCGTTGNCVKGEIFTTKGANNLNVMN